MAFPLLVAHLELWTQEQVPPDTTSPPQQERSERRSPRGCDLQVACSHTCGGGGRASPWGRTQVLAGGADLERKDGGDGSPQ